MSHHHATGETFTSTAGNDKFKATAGPDTFAFNFVADALDPSHNLINTGHDTIKGFKPGQDHLTYSADVTFQNDTGQPTYSTCSAASIPTRTAS